MTKNVRFADWQAEQMKDWRFRLRRYVYWRPWWYVRLQGNLWRLRQWVAWKLWDGVYCPFCGACGEAVGCCDPEMCDHGWLCPYREEYDAQVLDIAAAEVPKEGWRAALDRIGTERMDSGRE